jgi:putative ABC transport system permease protein
MIFNRSAGHIRSGFDTVRRTKLRSFGTMAGIIIGVASVISIVAIGNGIKKQVSGQIHGYGANLITVRSGELSASGGTGSLSALYGLDFSTPLNQKDVNTVSKVGGVNASAPLTIVGGKVNGDNGTYNRGFVIGTSPDLPILLNQSLAYGNFFNSSETGANVAILGQDAANRLFNESVPLGHSFTFHNQQFIVYGIFNQFTSLPLSEQANFNDAIFIPNQVAETLSDNTAPTYEILARASNMSQTKLTASNINSALTTAHGGGGGFSVATSNENISQNNDILNLLTALIAGVAAISLLVAGIGIMNVMLVSVTERVREIGIKKAVGATNRQIWSQFMVEATLISLVGGLIGIALAYAVEAGFLVATNLKPSISWQIVAIAAGTSLLVGIVFGTVPAIKAARKDPIDALRAE